MRLTGTLSFLALLALMVSATGCSVAQEETSSEETTSEETTDVKTVISDYIEQDRNLKGAFLIRDEKAAIVRELQFDYVHDSVNETDDGKYLMCVDFKEGEKVLDLDFYVTASPSGELSVSDIIIHKIDGKDVTKE